MTTSPHHIGWIPYWNLLPLRVELEKAFGDSLRLQTGHPTEINRALLQQNIHLAPCSAISLLLNPDAELAFPLGVACDGSVQSVYLGINNSTCQLLSEFSEAVRLRLLVARDVLEESLQEHPNDLRKATEQFWREVELTPQARWSSVPRLKCTQASASGATLSKIFHRVLFGQEVITDHDMSLELIIGDEALTRRPQFQKILDLGQMWKILTDLPFVFATWQTTQLETMAHLSQKFKSCAEIAEAKMRVDASDYLPSPRPLTSSGSEVDLLHYWKIIYYRLGPRELRSLKLFLWLSASTLKIDYHDKLIIKMHRWSDHFEGFLQT